MCLVSPKDSPVRSMISRSGLSSRIDFTFLICWLVEFRGSPNKGYPSGAGKHLKRGTIVSLAVRAVTSRVVWGAGWGLSRYSSALITRRIGSPGQSRSPKDSGNQMNLIDRDDGVKFLLTIFVGHPIGDLHGKVCWFGWSCAHKFHRDLCIPPKGGSQAVFQSLQYGDGARAGCFVEEQHKDTLEGSCLPRSSSKAKSVLVPARTQAVSGRYGGGLSQRPRTLGWLQIIKSSGQFDLPGCLVRRKRTPLTRSKGMLFDRIALFEHLPIR